MKKIIWDQNYTVNTFLVNPQKKLGLYGLLNLFQDTAWIHATHLGHGYEKMLEEKTAWVLTRQKLRMSEWPKWGKDIYIRTWIRPVNSIVAVRDFEVFEAEKKIGDCTTQWLILDLNTRRPAEKIPGLNSEEYRQDYHLDYDAQKISQQKDAQEIGKFCVRNSDLDLNGHVNNTKYAQWILDAVSEAKHREYSLLEYEVNFIAETKSQDVIIISRKEITENYHYFQGTREQDRKIVFAATMKVQSQQMSPVHNQF